MKLFDVLLRVAQNPNLYIGERDLLKLDGFLCGYAVCLSDHNCRDTDDSIMTDFQNFVAEKYQCKSALRWTNIILLNSKYKEEAFDHFVALLEAYKKHLSTR